MKTNKRKWGLYFRLLVKKQLKSPRIYCLMGLCLLFLLVFQNIVFPASYRMEYGIFLDGAECGQDVLDRLAKDDLYRYVLVDSREALMDEVRAGRLDCGFVLDKRLDEVETLADLDKRIDYICSTSTTKGSILKEKVFAAYLMSAAKLMLAAYSRDGKTFAQESEELTRDITGLFTGYLERGETLQVIFETVEADGKAQSSTLTGNAPAEDTAAQTDAAGSTTAQADAAGVDEEQTAASDPAGKEGQQAENAAADRKPGSRRHNTLTREHEKAETEGSVQEENKAEIDFSEVSLLDRFLALCGTLIFAAAIVFGRTRFSLECRRMTEALRGMDRAVWPFLSILAPVMLVDILITAAYLIGLWIYKSLTLKGALLSVLIFLIYGIVCAVWSYLYSLLFRKEAMYLGTIVGVIVLSLLTCRAFFNISSFLPALGFLKWIFPVNYLLL